MKPAAYRYTSTQHQPVSPWVLCARGRSAQRPLVSRFSGVEISEGNRGSHDKRAVVVTERSAVVTREHVSARERACRRRCCIPLFRCPVPCVCLCPDENNHFVRNFAQQRTYASTAAGSKHVFTCQGRCCCSRGRVAMQRLCLWTKLPIAFWEPWLA